MTDAPRACKNTDREIWRDGDGEGYYTPDCASIFVTEDGGIGISVNGNVIVRPVREWHRALSQESLAWHGHLQQKPNYQPLPGTPQSVPTCTCSKHPLWDGYDGDCPIHGWFEPVAPGTPQSVPADKGVLAHIASLIAERDKLKEELTAEIKLGDARSAECHSLRAERDKLTQACDGYLGHAANLRGENAKLEERVSVLEGALESIALRDSFLGELQEPQAARIARAALTRTSEEA
jgi:hypothetical protein